MTITPNKHYSAHKGSVFLQDIFAVTDGKKTEFFGRFGIIRSVFDGAVAEDVITTSIPSQTPKSAFLSTHKLMNETRKLGKCLVGYEPFDGKPKK